MKKIIALLSVAAVISVMSCNNKPAEAQKVIIVAPATPVVVEKKPVTIVLDKNGVKVEAKKVDVTIKKQ